MERKQFRILINAPKQKVWEILWGDNTYPEWTSVFAPGSKAETDWKKGSKVIFGDGKGQGMVATIAESIPNEFMSFKHLGTVKDGIEDYESPETKQWAGALENYTLQTKEGLTELVVDMDINDDYADYFMKTWPQAMDKIKQLAEG
jgi:hypothetical protein